eukprot:SAG11_NODE_1711_length_4401_cov_4.188052_1_plen_35_part_00
MHRDKFRPSYDGGSELHLRILDLKKIDFGNASTD